MQVFEKGQYSGSVTQLHSEAGIVATVTTYQPGAFVSAAHYHNNAHFSFMLKGACSERKKSSYDIRPGYLVYYSAGEQHQITRIGNMCMRVNVEMEQNFFSATGVSDETARIAISTQPDAKFLMVKMYRELQTHDLYSLPSIQMLLLKLIAATNKSERGSPPWLATVRELLHDKWNETITLQELSKEARTSEVNISKYFPLYFSCTLGSYMRKLKIERALGLMKSTNLSLTRISLEYGFADQSHFTRVFKEYIGCLPKHYLKL